MSCHLALFIGGRIELQCEICFKLLWTVQVCVFETIKHMHVYAK